MIVRRPLSITDSGEKTSPLFLFIAVKWPTFKGGSNNNEKKKKTTLEDLSTSQYCRYYTDNG